MGFLGVYKAIYDYAPQSDGELPIKEGDLLYILEKSNEDDWWKAKKKASADEDDEPVGLIPNNYVEEARPVAQARALYEYTRQTDEELSFAEEARLQVYDTSDPDWILAGFKGDYGFIPANYIEMADGGGQEDSEPAPSPMPPTLPSRAVLPTEQEQPQIPPPLPDRRSSVASETSPVSPPPGPATALAGVMQGRSGGRDAPPSPISIPPRHQQLEESDQEPSPALPARPRTQSTLSNDQSIPPERFATRHEYEDEHSQPPATPLAPGGFHMYNISEMVSVMGKKKKMPTTLGINLRTGVILIAYERSQDGPTQEWTAEKMTHYSREGKHVFLELVRPSKSIDFHAGAKDTAEEIVSALGELAGAMRAEGLREVIMAGTGQSSLKRGKVLYDFMAQGDDEVTVAAGDEVVVIDDTKSEEWWQVRRLKNGREGVVPSSYIETIGAMTSPTINSGMSTVAQNRLEEERLFKEAVKRDQRAAERSKGENGRAEGGRSHPPKSKPDPSKVRTWTDRSKSFSVEAQFIGLKDGKINLHKMNGVKIAVPIAKMSIEDIEYVERITNRSLDEDKPLSEVKRAKAAQGTSSSLRDTTSAKVGASIQPAKPDYDWFQFFLSCEVAVGLCERYAQAFAKDSMDESVLPDVDATVLRNLGLREGDIIKVMRHLDKKFGRDGNRRNAGSAGGEEGAENGSAGGLFSGPGGTLRNNTRKGRPAPAVQTSDTVDPKAFSQQRNNESEDAASTSSATTRPKAADRSTNGFDDDAWDVKPSRRPEPQEKRAPAAESQPSPSQTQRPPTQAMQDLSLLSTPLEPTKVQSTPSPSAASQAPPSQPQQQSQVQQSQAATPLSQPQVPGASPAFFADLGQPQAGTSPAPTGSAPPAQPLNLGVGSRLRPTPPQMAGGQGVLMPPPPSRPLSAPQSAQPSGFAPPPLQPQVTGIAPPGQSLNELNQQRVQQQYMGGFQPQHTGQGAVQFSSSAGMPQQPGSNFGAAPFMQPMVTGTPQMQSPFGDPRPPQFLPIQTQPTGFPGGYNSGPQFAQQGAVNSYLPPALEPQRTGIPPTLQPQQTGFAVSGQGFNPSLNNNINSQPPPAVPLLPQKTGPPPPVRFGVTEKMAPQPTGRRANLAQATPENPFGF
ncbi:hypothetical protein DL764_006784 [Monosporascus ibericus]|uniref:Actin cytoskeleton-regulatory complex protein SLA1 n=1 Tax=Monosporascus ibericus TaxID=155417 RepID=A0A4Q4T3V7_9PEZI|nr:hypothetical protein DL764_006784 [Monosporascus ibericus]